MFSRGGASRALPGGAEGPLLRGWRSFVEKLPWLYLAACAIAVFYLCEDEHIAMHTHWYRDNLLWLTYGHWGFGYDQLIAPFRNFNFRARFLSYFVEEVDHYLRLYLYQYGRVPTNFSLAYIPEFASVWLFYKLLVNLAERRLSACLGVAFYASSVGFTSGLSLVFFPGKALSNVAFIVVAYVASEMWKSDPEKLFYEHPLRCQLAVIATTFLALNLDEAAFFAPVIAPMLFPSMFLGRGPARSAIGRSLLNLLFYLSPVFLFAIFVLIVVPTITPVTWGYSFNFIGTVLSTNEPPEHPGFAVTGAFTLDSLYRNFLALLSRCFLPSWSFSRISIGDKDPLKELYLIGIVAGLACLALLQEDSRRRLTLRALILAGLYIFFSAALNGRHTIIVDGYYYGSSVSVFVSLSLALACDAACRWGTSGRHAAILLAALPIACQIDNSVHLARVNQMMYESFTVDWFKKFPTDMRPFPIALDPHRGVTRWELDRIWRLWQEGRWTELRAETISPGSVYLLYELDRLDRLKAGGIPSGLLGAETIQH